MKKRNLAFVFGALALSACTLIPTSKETLKAVADEGVASVFKVDACAVFTFAILAERAHKKSVGRMI